MDEIQSSTSRYSKGRTGRRLVSSSGPPAQSKSEQRSGHKSNLITVLFFFKVRGMSGFPVQLAFKSDGSKAGFIDKTKSKQTKHAIDSNSQLVTDGAFVFYAGTFNTPDTCAMTNTTRCGTLSLPTRATTALREDSTAPAMTGMKYAP